MSSALDYCKRIVDFSSILKLSCIYFGYPSSRQILLLITLQLSKGIIITIKLHYIIMRGQWPNVLRILISHSSVYRLDDEQSIYLSFKMWCHRQENWRSWSILLNDKGPNGENIETLVTTTDIHRRSRDFRLSMVP